MSNDPLASFYALTPERLRDMRERFPLHAPLIDELQELVPYIKRMASESNVRKLSGEERTKLMSAALRMSAIAIELQDNPHPVKQ
jgi:hypothetical protein